MIMIFQSLCLGLLPLLDAVGGLVSNLLHSSAVAAFDRLAIYGGQYTHGLSNDDDEEDSKSTHVVEDDGGGDALDWQQLWTMDLLDTSHVHVDLVFPCACHAAARSAPSSCSSFQRSDTERNAIFRRGSSSSSRSLWWRLVARHEEQVTYAVVVATLQLFLRLTRANATTLFLPMLAQATGRGRVAAQAGDAVLVLVSTCGVLGSALAARQLGRETMCAISGVLIVACQVAVPSMAAGLSAGGTRLRGGRAAAEMFAAACAVSCGFSWAWGALFWAVPCEGIRSAGQAAGAALGFGLGFAQMQCFLLTLRQLKHAAFAYYAVWIWS
ncbi:hypothetical protein U9M48_032768 [Paspalum notatum var. saurae]|uniref:Solute carrier family 40 protein n=1 Tax=Paspalum notatum var. saurae TaxID=547442 RepID=A0AAQ3U9B7_PASNO